MKMTEQMAIRELEANIDLPFGVSVSAEASKMAIQALEERQQYREIGTVEAITTRLAMLEAYEAIDTIKNLQALKEKSVAKKAIVSRKHHESYCPTCDEVLTDDEFWALDISVIYCEHCGQAVQGTEYVD